MLDIINIGSDLRNALGDENHRFDICKQIPLTDLKSLEELFPHPGVYIFHGENSEVLNICRSQNSIGANFYAKVKGDWTGPNGVVKKPFTVSAIILNRYSAKFAKEIKKILGEWLNPVFKK